MAAAKKNPPVKEEPKMTNEEHALAAGSPVKNPEEVPPAAPVAPVAPKPTGKVRPAGIGPGRIVLFTRSENTQTGSKLVQHAAMILGDAQGASNFQPEDGAVDLKVFTRHGDEIKSGVMFSEAYKPGFWSFVK